MEMHKEKCASEILNPKLFKNASNDVVSRQKMKMKTVGLIFYTYAQVLLIANICILIK